jgi:hypothetical protein
VEEGGVVWIEVWVVWIENELSTLRGNPYTAYSY